VPYKSDAQRRKFHAMLARGEISRSVVDEYDRASKGLDLPERVGKRPQGPKKGSKKRHTSKASHYLGKMFR
jgi:hypothetical protein